MIFVELVKIISIISIEGVVLIRYNIEVSFLKSNIFILKFGPGTSCEFSCIINSSNIASPVISVLLTFVIPLIVVTSKSIVTLSKFNTFVSIKPAVDVIEKSPPCIVTEKMEEILE